MVIWSLNINQIKMKSTIKEEKIVVATHEKKCSGVAAFYGFPPLEKRGREKADAIVTVFNNGETKVLCENLRGSISRAKKENFC